MNIRLIKFLTLGLLVSQLINLPAPELINLSTEVFAQHVGVGVELTPGSPVKNKNRKINNRNEDPFLVELAGKFGREEKELHKLHNRGYGYTELIKLILISEKANKSLEEVIKKRDKGNKMHKIAEDYKLNYSDIYSEALEIRKEIDNSLLTGQPLTKPTTTHAETRESEQNPEK